ncbi:MAG: hypothetical protein NTV51_32180 [Verrucomicrobia bacterium]|nr:hypothetical protein [Verrucomicrobiota bacterium]
MKSPQTYLIALLALTTLGGVALSWQQYSELVELRAAAMNRDERADLQKRVWDLEKLNKQLRDQRLAGRAPGDGPEGPTGNGPGDEPPGRGGRGRSGNPLGQLNALRDLMAKPEVLALLNVQQKAAVDARYAALFKSLNLTPDQAEKLRTILAERQTTMQDVMSAAREQGLDPRSDRDAYQKLMEVARTDINNSIKSVIGESGFAQFENYEQTLPQRNVVNQLKQRLSDTDTPLTSAQADQLVQILAANTPPPTSRAPGSPPDGAAVVVGRGGPDFGGRGGPDFGALGAVIGGALGGGPGGQGGGLFALGGGPGGASTSTAPITANAVNQAQAVLAGPQVAALQQLQQQQQSQQQLNKIIADTISAQNAANGPRGGTPPPPPPTKKGG